RPPPGHPATHWPRISSTSSLSSPALVVVVVVVAAGAGASFHSMARRSLSGVAAVAWRSARAICLWSAMVVVAMICVRPDSCIVARVRMKADGPPHHRGRARGRPCRGPRPPVPWPRQPA
ncbi:hypothetical protein BDZ88DRAFT_418416, partial [Geranomyces variabilis]